MADRRRLTALIMFIAAGAALLPGPAYSQRTKEAQAAPRRTTPLPPTTTQERLVNSTGLTEPAMNGWHTDFIGPGRGFFDASFGIKFWPGRTSFRNLIFGGAVDLAPGIRARGYL